MADNNAAPAASDDGEQQVTFNVKSSSDSKYVLTVSAASTVGDLKQKLSSSAYADLPPERQRLIYSGRVLKDHDTIGACKIKEGNTVHLVKGAESNSRQNPANQGGSAPVPGAGQPASNVPTSFATGTGADPLAQLTGARYAGFHGLPGMDMFGADGGMGAPPNPDQMLRMLEDPNVAQQINEAMNNPAVLNMMRNNPMIRNNPIMRQAIENPEFRRMMMNPDMIRMQMQMQRAMGGAEGAQSAFPMPGQTDTTQTGTGTGTTGAGTPASPRPNTTAGATGAAGATGNTQAQNAANPFAALFPGAGQAGADSSQQQQSPFASMFGGGGAAPGGEQNNSFQQMTQQLMQNPEAMQQMMRMMGGGAETGEGAQNNPLGGFNPFAFGGGMGGFGQQQQQQTPPDNRPPEERYADQLRQLNDMGFYEFDRNVQALRRSGGSVQGAVEYLLSSP